ncbi:DNA-binding response regulator (plasmid) [Neorhizobium sp. SOG26]|jgi:Response regulators consisting of a CheY-like receiver domain and a winged-helix DNA-binding domain|uniref:Response regulator transcription factor n=1 Tax=Neorhizobium turbinariae TaxID=2937795 RepID=A0ABT0INL6_9HYPH|nr:MULTISPECIES: response regulator transcription factor [Neorhizobium]AXV18098.1 DNA-binding response regulator [Neorhizobium sp. SOG26]MCK8779449.1 response regulator transcription factor [Neorhizobium turbinariae]
MSSLAPAGSAVVAIVDDDTELRQSIATLLIDNGFVPVPVADSAGFFAAAANQTIDLAMIDLRLQGESGLTLAIHIRERMGLPIVMLTGRGDETDKIIGLETGADDYIMKPFNPRELVARLRAVLRRTGHASLSLPDRSQNQIRTFGRFRLDQSRRELIGPDGNEIPLTNAEYRMLEYFVRNPDRVIPRTDLLRELGSDLSQYMDRTIDVLIMRLRRKIEPVPAKPVHLQTRRGHGYIFVTTT